MIQYVTGDVMGLSKNDCDAFVVSVNAKGVSEGHSMVEALGSSQRAENYTKQRPVYQRRFASAYSHYKLICGRGDLEPGDITTACLVKDDVPSGIVFAVTTDSPEDGSKLEWIEKICEDIRDASKELGWTRIAMPMLGTGSSGKLPSKAVARIIRKVFGEDPDLKISLYIPATLMAAIMDSKGNR